MPGHEPPPGGGHRVAHRSCGIRVHWGDPHPVTRLYPGRSAKPQAPVGGGVLLKDAVWHAWTSPGAELVVQS